MLEAVSLAVGVGGHGRVSELRARLDVEEEEQAVHVSQAFPAQLVRQGVVVQAEELVVAHVAHVPDDLVADQLDRLAERVLQVLGDGEGVLVAVLVQAVQKAMALPVRGQQAVAVEQDGGRLERGVVAAAQNLREVEAQQPVVRPLASLQQQRLAERQQEEPTGRMPLAEHAVRRDVLPAFLSQRRRRRRLAEELGGMWLDGQRVVAFCGRVVGLQDQQLLCARAASAGGAQDGDLDVVVEREVGRGPVGFVPQRVEQAAEPLALGADLVGVDLVGGLLDARPPGRPSLEGVAKPGVVLGQCAEGHVGRGLRRVGRALRRVVLPALDRFLDVAGEDLRQVVVAVELVFVVDSGEGRGGF